MMGFLWWGKSKKKAAEQEKKAKEQLQAQQLKPPTRPIPAALLMGQRPAPGAKSKQPTRPINQEQAKTLAKALSTYMKED